jgi:MOSC domain-containing protein YiiM
VAARPAAPQVRCREGAVRQRRQAAVTAGDAIKIVRQPSHDVTVSLVFRALTVEPDILPLILVADALPTECRDAALRRTAG